MHIQDIVHLEPGQFTATFSIPIVDNPDWTPESVQEVVLSDPTNAVLGELKVATIVVLDDDLFPRNHTREYCFTGQLLLPACMGSASADTDVEMLKEVK